MNDDVSASSENAETIVRRYWQSVWLERDLDTIDELYADPTIRHTPEGNVSTSRAELKAHLAGSLRALRGESFSIDALDVVEDRAWTRITLRGVSLAAMTPITVTHMAQYRIENGHIAEVWSLNASSLDWHGSARGALDPGGISGP